MPDYDRKAIVFLEAEQATAQGMQDMSRKALAKAKSGKSKAEIETAQALEGSGELLQSLTEKSRLYVIGHGDAPVVLPQSAAADFAKVKPGTRIAWKVAADKMGPYTPQTLAIELHKQGLRKCKVLYLVCCNSGRGGDTSFAARFAKEIRAIDGVQIAEVRAPEGFVRTDKDGHKNVRAKGWFEKQVDESLKFISSNENSELPKGKNKVTF